VKLLPFARRATQPAVQRSGAARYAKWLAGALGALTLSSAFAQAIVVTPAPPPPRVEVLPPPQPGAVWDPGHWRWVGGRYEWIPGHWRRVRIGYHWVPGHWVARGPRWFWVEGHWAR
jgi:hypothetical protein